MVPLESSFACSVGQLKLDIATDLFALEIRREEWDQTVASLDGPVYLTYDWLRTWWQHYGQQCELRVFLFSVDGLLVGLLPLYVDTLGVAPLHLKVARLVGANIPAKVFDPPLHPNWASTCIERATRHLILNDGVDVVSLGPVSALYTARPQLAGAAARLFDVAKCSEKVVGVHTIFHLPERMRDYLQSLGKGEQKNRRKYELRTMQKEYAVCVDVVSDSSVELLREFERFADQHTRQWEAQEMRGHFGSWPDGLAYNRALVKVQGALGRVRFIRIWADDEIVASQYVFGFAGRWWWELPSRNVSEKWDRFSLGPTGIVIMIREAINEGVRRIDGGLGHYDYKLRLRAQEHSVIRFECRSRRFGSRLRQGFFGGIRCLLQLGYHRIWYRRLVPWLPPCLRRSQWRLWLRFDY